MASILVIDDEFSVVDLIENILTHFGYQVRKAESADEGLSLFRQSPADLVITDIVMPGKSGLDLIRELKQEAPAVPILALSGGSGGSGVLELALEAGADQTLRKPFNVPDLVEAVKGLAGKEVG